MYNQPELLSLSGDKIEFAKVFKKFNWLPKTVFSKKEAIEGAVGFPVVAKIKDGHSGIGIQKFDTAKELQDSKETFDLYCQFIDFDREYRVAFCKEKIFLIYFMGFMIRIIAGWVSENVKLITEPNKMLILPFLGGI